MITYLITSEDGHGVRLRTTKHSFVSFDSAEDAARWFESKGFRPGWPVPPTLGGWTPYMKGPRYDAGWAWSHYAEVVCQVAGDIPSANGLKFEI